jgi:hypothetical protein
MGGLKLQGLCSSCRVAAGFDCVTWAVPHALASRAAMRTTATCHLFTSVDLTYLHHSKLDLFFATAPLDRTPEIMLAFASRAMRRVVVALGLHPSWNPC